MAVRIAALALALAGTLPAGSPKPAKSSETRGENESVVILATVYSNPQAVKEVFGSDLDGHYVVLALKVTPRFGKEVVISRDDFLLKTDLDGARTTPFAPSQIAGRGALVISQTGGATQKKSGPTFGVGGIIGGPGGTGGGGATTVVQSKSRSGAHDKEDPILKVLTDKELPETKTDQPVSGLLYFPMEKQKVKDLELRYNPTGDDKIVLRFHQEK